MAPPDGDVVEVCHAYTCQMRTTFYFHQKEINEIAQLMRKTKRTDPLSRSDAPSPTPSPTSKKGLA
ncbi:MAG: hypothetical protein WA441_06870 [Methyloceanibacter sp.]